ncbi:MAG: WxL domain-containing protein [Candidatus Gracilibacteria bacterium]
MSQQKKLLIGAFLGLSINLLWAGSVYGQSSNQSTVSVNRAGSLSFTSIPSSFDFGVNAVPSQRTAAFSDGGVTSGNLPSNKKITIQDTRGEGGFMVTISANGPFHDENNTHELAISNTSPNDNLRVVTTQSFDGAAGTTTGGMVYENGFVGDQTVVARIATAATNFGDETTFSSVSNNILDTQIPVDVFDGTLPASSGRIGRVSAAAAAMLYIPPLQASGQYVTTLTWTLSDSTT